jgi:limonene-1,2-epoxide hydrolase
MTKNEQLLTTFYKAFQQRDYQTMQDCYTDDAVFNDEVFVNLNASEVRAMWEMLCKKGKDLELTFKNVNANEKSGKAEWTATYSFSKTKRKVVNHIYADFLFSNGKICNHRDHFNFYAWTRQAFGLTGILFGWTNWLKAKIQKEGKKNLIPFMKKI